MVDSICVGRGESHFGVPYVPGQSYSWQVQGGQITSKPDSSEISVSWNNVPGKHLVTAVASNGSNCPGDTSRYLIKMKGPKVANGKGPTQICRGSFVSFESSVVGNFKWSGGQTSRSIGFIAERDTVVSLIAINEPCPE
ncbi:MAG: hypothetical protein U5L96_02355 [Owenweeksia sp.]|nr:hypothetical protein [Owenweeksia sp.]